MATSDYYFQDNADIEVKKLEAAKGLYQSGNYSAALKLYLDLVNTSYSYKLNYEVARCYYKLGDIDNAEMYFQRSISLEEFRNPSYAFLGSMYFKRQDTLKAIEYWIKAYSFRPDDESVCLNLATSYFTKDMKFQSIFFYEKYLKYAKDKTASYYLEVKKTIEGFVSLSNEFYKKAQRALSMKDIDTAITALDSAVKTYPLSFDSNYLLGRLYLEKKEYLKSLVYFKQAYCLDNKSLDVLQRLSSVLINAGDFTGAYCCLKRMLPLVLNNQKEYLDVIMTIKQLENSFDNLSHQAHLDWADSYLKENNYHFALYEYENCLIIDNTKAPKITAKIQELKSYINPEERIIKTCFEKGMGLYSNGEYRQANKYFSKIMNLAKEDSIDYKMAKARLVNV